MGDDAGSEFEGLFAGGVLLEIDLKVLNAGQAGEDEGQRDGEEKQEDEGSAGLTS